MAPDRSPRTAPHPRPRRVAPRRLRTVALVGIDGSGKTTQAHRLAAELTARGLDATYCRNAGGRRWFGRLAVALGRADAQALLGRRGLLFAESLLRWLAIARALLRRLVTGQVAVMDRYAVCQYASIRTHAARPVRRGRIAPGERIARLAYALFPAPDVTFLLATDPQVAYRRIERRGTDHESLSYLTAASVAYRALPEFGSFAVIDGDGTPDQVAARILDHLAPWLPPVGPAADPLPDPVGVPAPRAALETAPDAAATPPAGPELVVGGPYARP